MNISEATFIPNVTNEKTKLKFPDISLTNIFLQLITFPILEKEKVTKLKAIPL